MLKLNAKGLKCFHLCGLRFSAALQKMIRFVLMVNQQGQVRLSRYFQPVELSRRAALEADAVRCCLSRSRDQVLPCMLITRQRLGL